MRKSPHVSLKSEYMFVFICHKDVKHKDIRTPLFLDWLLCALITRTVHHLDQRTHHTRVCCHSQISSHPTDIQHSQLWSLVSAILCSARQSSCLYSHVNLMRWLTCLNQKSPNFFDFKLIPATVYRWIFIYVFFFFIIFIRQLHHHVHCLQEAKCHPSSGG